MINSKIKYVLTIQTQTVKTSSLYSPLIYKNLYPLSSDYCDDNCFDLAIDDVMNKLIARISSCFNDDINVCFSYCDANNKPNRNIGVAEGLIVFTVILYSEVHPIILKLKYPRLICDDDLNINNFL